MTPREIQSKKLEELIARANAQAVKTPVEIKTTIPEAIIPLPAVQTGERIWNAEQLKCFDLIRQRKSFCIIGKAGTGKTTVARECITVLQSEGIIGPMRESTKWLQSGLPGCAVVSFTNRAVKNIARGMPKDIAEHTITIHKLLEFQPEYVDITDAEGKMKKVMKFLPNRNARNPLPASLKVIAVEESSMISTDLWKQLMDALPHECQFIFLGDLQQLPPVYGTAILGFKLLQLPVVELTHIYRQAAGSPIIDLAWRIASGSQIPKKEFDQINVASQGKLTIRPWKKKIDVDDALHAMDILFKQFLDAKIYDPIEDMVMIPYNKAFGTIEFNRNLAQRLGKMRDATVYEIIAGFNKHYFAIGDKVLCDRQEAIIEEITINDRYVGVMPIMPSKVLNRWGMYEIQESGQQSDHDRDLDDVENFMLQNLAARDKENEEAKQQASHILSCKLIGSDERRDIRTTGEYSATIFAYALTVHKCQGSEWRKCFLILHNSHAVMLNRELLYTAVTRAREELYILCEPDSLEKGVKTQRIKGNTIKEKAEYFKGKKEND